MGQNNPAVQTELSLALELFNVHNHHSLCNNQRKPLCFAKHCRVGLPLAENPWSQSTQGMGMLGTLDAVHSVNSIRKAVSFETKETRCACLCP